MNPFLTFKKISKHCCKISVASILLICSAEASFAQKKVAANKLTATEKNVNALKKVFKKQQLFSINTTSLMDYAKQEKNRSLQLDLEFEGLPAMPVVLTENNVVANDYTLIEGTATGNIESKSNPNVKTYSGKLANDANSSVYLTISDKTIFGFIKGNGKDYFVEALNHFDQQANDQSFVLYEREDVVENADATCGVTEVTQRLNESLPTDVRRGTAVGTCKMVRLAIASDLSMFQRYGTLQDVEFHTISIINTMVGIYSNAQFENEFLQFKIVRQYVSTAPEKNPYLPLYDGVDASTMLSNFRTWATSAGVFGSLADYDLGQAWTAKNMESNGSTGIIGLAFVGVVCRSARYQINEDFSSSGAVLAVLAAHETGHNLGALHDNVNGFIMAAGLDASNLANSFSLESRNMITDYLSTVNCLPTCSSVQPQAAFNLPKINCGLGPITITSQSVGAYSSQDLEWNMPGSNPSTANNTETVTLQYTTPGFKTVTLSVWTNRDPSQTLRSVVTREIFVDNPPSAGCRTAVAGNNEITFIRDFRLGDLRPSGQLFIGTGRYTDFSCTSQTLLRTDSTYNVNASIGYSGFLFGSGNVNISNKFQLFIDYNDDGDFTDAGESVYSSIDCNLGEINFPISIPATVPVMNRLLRLRIIAMPCNLPPSNGCAIPSNAQIQDYGIVLVGQKNTYYPDNDGDGFGSNTPVYLYASNTPAGYSTNNLDCDDSNFNITQLTWVEDKDGDNFYVGEKINQCKSPGVGFRIFNNQLLPGDCNDNNPLVNIPSIWITDVDEDGYYPGLPIVQCDAPTAFHIIKTTQLPGDCDDNNVSVNPGAAEICKNGIDDDCNGMVDEQGCYNCSNASSTTTNQITSNSAVLSWTSIPNAILWEVRYKATNQGTQWVSVLVPGNRRSLLITGLENEQIYMWQIRAKCGDKFTGFTGAERFITLAQDPIFSKSNINNNESGEVLETTSNTLLTYPNPTNGNVNLSLKLNTQNAVTALISIKDMIGKNVYAERIPLQKGLLQTNIHLPSNTAPGLYFIEVLIDGVRYNSKFMLLQ